MEEEPKHVVHHSSSGRKKRGFKIIRAWQLLTALFAVLLVTSIATSGFKSGEGSGLSADEISEKAEKYVNNNILQGQATAEISGAEEVSGVYLLKLNVDGQIFDSYATKDGSLFFPQVMNLEEVAETAEGSAGAGTSGVPKSDKPKVELFVMSHCPYGTQMEKGILPVAKELGDKIDFEVKFVNYAMHGETELDEELRQYCIQKEFRPKYASYLSCFLEDGNSERCVGETGIDEEVLGACVAEADEIYGISEAFADPEKAGWSGNYPPFAIHDEENVMYGVRGSPTLVINGQTASSGRDAQSLLNAICGAFNEAPEECGTDMTAYGAPAPGFGFDTQGGSATAAGCAG